MLTISSVNFTYWAVIVCGMWRALPLAILSKAAIECFNTYIHIEAMSRRLHKYLKESLYKLTITVN